MTVNKIYVIIKDTVNNIYENIIYFIDIQEIKNFLGDYTYSNIMDLLLFIIFIVIIPLKIFKYLYGLHIKLYLVKNNKFNNIDEILFNYSNYILEYNQRKNNNLKDKFRKEYLELCFILLSLYNKLVINGYYHICTIYWYIVSHKKKVLWYSLFTIMVIIISLIVIYIYNIDIYASYKAYMVKPESELDCFIFIFLMISSIFVIWLFYIVFYCFLRYILIILLMYLYCVCSIYGLVTGESSLLMDSLFGWVQYCLIYPTMPSGHPRLYMCNPNIPNIPKELIPIVETDYTGIDPYSPRTTLAPTPWEIQVFMNNCNTRVHKGIFNLDWIPTMEEYNLIYQKLFVYFAYQRRYDNYMNEQIINNMNILQGDLNSYIIPNCVDFPDIWQQNVTNRDYTYSIVNLLTPLTTFDSELMQYRRYTNIGSAWGTQNSRFTLHDFKHSNVGLEFIDNYYKRLGPQHSLYTDIVEYFYYLEYEVGEEHKRIQKLLERKTVESAINVGNSTPPSHFANKNWSTYNNQISRLELSIFTRWGKYSVPGLQGENTVRGCTIHEFFGYVHNKKTFDDKTTYLVSKPIDIRGYLGCNMTQLELGTVTLNPGSIYRENRSTPQDMLKSVILRECLSQKIDYIVKTMENQNKSFISYNEFLSSKIEGRNSLTKNDIDGIHSALLISPKYCIVFNGRTKNTCIVDIIANKPFWNQNQNGFTSVILQDAKRLLKYNWPRN